eukprot:6987080-Prymnesium_polylepis.1
MPRRPCSRCASQDDQMRLPALPAARCCSRAARCTGAKGWGGDFEKSQPYKSVYTTSQNTYQKCPKRPR